MNLKPFLKKRQLLLAVFLMLCRAAFGQNKTDNLLQANIYFAQKNYFAAAAAYSNVIQAQKLQDTAMGKLYLLRGECYRFLNEFDKAHQDYTVSIKLYPNNYNIFWERGLLYQANGRHSKAINDFYTSLSLLASSDTLRRSLLYSCIAYNQYQQHEPDSTLKNDSTAISFYKKNSRAYAWNGCIYLSRNNYSQAIIDYRKAIYYNTEYYNAIYLSFLYASMGDAKRLEKQFKEAINDYSYALKINPDNKIVYWNRGAAYHYHKDYELAADDYTKAMNYYQDDKKQLSNLYYDRAENELGQWHLAKAIQDDSMAVKLTSIMADNALQPAYPQLAIAYLRNGDYQKSISVTKKIFGFQIIRIKQNSPLYEQMANSEYFLKKFDKSIDYSSIAINLNPQSSLAYYYRGRAYLKRADQKEMAMNDFNKAIAVDTSKKSAGYLFSLFYAGRGDEAAAILQQQLLNADDNVQTVNDYYDLACLYSLMDKPDKANNYLKMAIDKGYSKKYARDDDDLNNIRNTIDFEHVVQGSE